MITSKNTRHAESNNPGHTKTGTLDMHIKENKPDILKTKPIDMLNTTKPRHAKSKTTFNKGGSNYTKKYRGQGR